jgi:hypothetical protein
VAKYPARKGVIYLSTSGSGSASAVIGLNKWTLDQTTDKIDVTAFGDTNKTYVQGLPDIKGTFSGFWDDTETKPGTGASSTDGVKLYLYPSSDAATKYKCGPAWLDLSFDVSVSGAVAVNGSFVANGSWSNSTI